MREPLLSYGQRAVGLSFNPSGDETVHKLKSLYAQIIDLCVEGLEVCRNTPGPSDAAERARLFQVAITEAQAAQMWAVKAQTWRVLDG